MGKKYIIKNISMEYFSFKLEYNTVVSDCRPEKWWPIRTQDTSHDLEAENTAEMINFEHKNVI